MCQLWPPSAINIIRVYRAFIDALHKVYYQLVLTQLSVPISRPVSKLLPETLMAHSATNGCIRATAKKRAVPPTNGFDSLMIAMMIMVCRSKINAR